jgi:hypothetical protein
MYAVIIFLVYLLLILVMLFLEFLFPPLFKFQCGELARTLDYFLMQVTTFSRFH